MRPLSPSAALVLVLASLSPAGCKDPADSFGGLHESGGGDGGGGGGGDDTGGGGEDLSLQAAIDRDLEANLATAVSIAVWQDGAVVWAEGFGNARPSGSEPVTADTLFQIGSTTKMHTAIGLLQQVEAGRLALDAPLSEALPNLDMDYQPGITADISVEQLLFHHGAFYDWIDWQQEPDDELLQTYTYEVFDDNLWVMAPPGSFWNYSNPNFILQGVLTEDLDPEGRFWPDYMVDEVYAPLGMDRTFLRKSEVYEDGGYALGVGYTDLNTGEIGNASIAVISDPGWARPAGLAWSTPTQQLQLARLFLEGEEDVLSEALVAELTAAQVPIEELNPEAGHGYGYGLFVSPGLTLSETEYVETPYWHHGGNTLWFTSGFHVLPEHGFAVSILSNGLGDDFSETTAAVLRAFVDDLPAATSPTDYELDPGGLDAHVGTYLDPFNVGELGVSREGDGLVVSFPVLDELGFDYDPVLYGVSTNLWYVDIEGAWYDLRFLDPEGTGASAYAASRAFVAARDEILSAAGPPAEAAPSDAASPELRAARLRRTLAQARPEPLTLPPALRR